MVMDVMEHLLSIPPSQMGDHQPCIHSLNKALNKADSKHSLRLLRRESNPVFKGIPIAGLHLGHCLGRDGELSPSVGQQPGHLSLGMHTHGEVLVCWVQALMVHLGHTSAVGRITHVKK